MRNFLGLAIGIALGILGLILIMYGLSTPPTVFNQNYIIGSLLAGIIMFLAGLYMVFRFSKEMNSGSSNQAKEIKIEADSKGANEGQTSTSKSNNSKTHIATFKQRLKAYSIDAALGILTLVIIGFGGNAGGIGQFLSVLVALGFIATQFYFFSKSTTPGKYFFDMMIIDQNNGEPVGYWKMLFRQVIAFPISQLILGLGIIWIFRDDKNQGWHDKIIDGLVIKISSSPKQAGEYL